jgi:hypothetical protein
MPRTDHNITFVENRGLAGGDAEGGLVQPEAEPIGSRLDLGPDGRRPVAELRVAPRDRGEQASGSRHLTARK